MLKAECAASGHLARDTDEIGYGGGRLVDFFCPRCGTLIERVDIDNLTVTERRSLADLIVEVVGG